ncbi:hypothetical protein AAG570_007977 [Ranatra chinensis]|uniref:Uncharacterized protein n=1 Tax=Ranatra chinensis TaxID=642074 RepID=A0ABD0XTD8_9HEMI
MAISVPPFPTYKPHPIIGGPDGVVFSICDYHAEGPGFDSLRGLKNKACYHETICILNTDVFVWHHYVYEVDSLGEMGGYMRKHRGQNQSATDQASQTHDVNREDGGTPFLCDHSNYRASQRGMLK